METIYQYPVQDSLPAGVQFGNFGVDGKQGFRLTAPSSGSIAMVQRVPLPQSATMSVELHAFIQNHLVAANNGREGVGFQVRGLRHEESGARVVYTNAIGTSSEPDKWHNENRGEEWHRVVTIEEIPQNLGIDSLDVMILVKASSGYIDISQVGCRNHNARYFQFNAPGPTTGLQSQIEDRSQVLFGNGAVLLTRYSRNAYLGTISLDVIKGERVSLQSRFSLSGSFSPNIAESEGIMEIGVAIKMRRRTGEYDTFPTSRLSSGNNFEVVDEITSTTIKAQYDYTQGEILAFAKATFALTDFTSTLEHQGVDAEVIVRGAIDNST